MKPFDVQELVKELAPIVVVPAAGVIVDWAAKSLEANENNYVKILGGLVRGMKQPLLDELTKAINASAASAPAETVAG